jgi:hypothetical protein
VTDLISYSPSFTKPPSPLRRFVDSLSTAHEVAGGVSPYARAGLHTLRAAGTSSVLGITLGAVDAKWGLEVGKRKIPIDGLLALAGAAASLAFARDQDGLSIEARSTMSVAGGIFLYRKTKAWMESKHASAPHGERAGNDNDNDPIMAAARGLDAAAE